MPVTGGAFSLTGRYLQYRATLQTTDSGLSPTLRSVTVSYGPPPPNQDPTFDQNLGDRTDAEGDLISLDAGATDPDGDTLTYAASGLPAGSIDTATGEISGTISLSAASGSPYAVSVTVRDGAAVDATDTFSWTVTNTNQDPTFDQNLGDRTDAEGDLISLDAGATDPDGDTLTYAASGLPAACRSTPPPGRSRHHQLQRRQWQPLRGQRHRARWAAVDATDTFSWTVTNTNQDPTFDQNLADQHRRRG